MGATGGATPIPSYIITQAFAGLFQKTGSTAIDYDSDTIQVALLCDGFDPDTVRHTGDFVDDFISDEYASVPGYARKTLGTKTMTVSSSNNGQIVFSSAAITYTELAVSAGQTVTHMLFLKDVGGLDSTRPAICILNLVEIGQSFTGTANDVTITPPSGGWFRFANNA